MTTLEQIFFKNQEKFIEETGDEEDIPYWVIEKSVKEWLQQKQEIPYIENGKAHITEGKKTPDGRLFYCPVCFGRKNAFNELLEELDK